MDRRRFLQGLGATGIASVFSPLASSTPSLSNAGNELATRPSSVISALNPSDQDSLRILLIAIGGAATSIVAPLSGNMPGFNKVIAIDTNPFSVARIPGAHPLLLGEHDSKPVTPGAAKALAKANSVAIREKLTGAHMAIVLSGLGGSTGTGAAPLVAEIARELGVLTLSMAVMPFEWEGTRRAQIATAGLHAAARRSDVILPVANNVLAKHAGQDALVVDVLRQGQEAVQNLYWNLAGCLHQQGLVGIDFEDVRTILGSGIAALGWGSAQGDSRATTATLAAIHHPLLGIQWMSRAHGVQVSIRSARARLKMREVNAVMQTVKASIPEEANLVFSADYDESMAEAMAVSILAAAPLRNDRNTMEI